MHSKQTHQSQYFFYTVLIQSINISLINTDNKIGDSGATEIVNALKTNISITELSLPGIDTTYKHLTNKYSE